MTKTGCCGRGILAFETCKPARRPGERLAARSVLTTSTSTSSNGATSDAAKPSSESETDSNTTNQPQTQVPVPPIGKGKKPVKLLAKYNYEANPNRPGGFDELSLKQAEKLEFVQAHPANPFWWKARNSDNQLGYVPASYLMVLEEKPSSLPWLEQKREAEQKEDEDKDKENNRNPGVFGPAPPGTFKPYVSAYNNKVVKTPQQERQWYCELCYKQLNGPQPYQAHMVSRAHKDELEAQGLS